MDGYRLYIGKFSLAQDLISKGILPLEIKANPFDPEKKIWIFDGTRETATLAKSFYDNIKMPYSRSLQTLIGLIEKADGGADE